MEIGKGRRDHGWKLHDLSASYYSQKSWSFCNAQA
jgi:hypothetical protein